MESSLFFFHKFLKDQIETISIIVIQIYISFSLHHGSKHLIGAKIRRASEDSKCLVSNIFFDDIREPKIDEDRFLEMFAHDDVQWFDVVMNDLEGVHDFQLLLELTHGRSCHFFELFSLLCLVLNAVIVDHDVEAHLVADERSAFEH